MTNRKNMSRHIITGIDVGTSTVRVVVAEPRTDGAISSFSLLGYGLSPAVGMRRGAVVDVSAAAESIRQAVEKAAQHAGVAIDHAYVGFGGSGFGSIMAKGIVAVSRADGEISEADIVRVHAVARANLPSLANKEILQELVVQYAVDKESSVRQPIGMIGNRLEAHILYLTAFSPHLRNLVRAIEAAGISVDDIVPAPLASVYATLTKHQQQIGVLHLDLGGETATCAVYDEGSLLSIQVFPVGATHITHDIAIGFQLPLEAAEAIKIAHGAVAGEESAFRREMIHFGEFAPHIPLTVSRWDLAEIMEARTVDIFELVEKYLRRMGRAGLLPAGVIFTGGGARVPGLVEFSRRALRLPAQVGTIHILDAEHELAGDAAWATAVGLVGLMCTTRQKSRVPNFIPSKWGGYVMRLIRSLIP
ncbi:MAG: cell division protein FtsA [Candidatus Ryanbacteria bacterium RIFCSPLOWO2_02_FULL_45_11c]|uniref:Cell division protein FtsA n=1 Tax=Candidatus Ryanbacteria bacterium RIFCSPLOWO2_02_FULL_45_11c TaxID=1802128 RepID=A0A1G2H157_9BACT|nr:MAG: cell division protein FtsA [Candidatus Ryanbacteria bacterium RIFCSPLOWO2_02_FULL_45_11c]